MENSAFEAFASKLGEIKRNKVCSPFPEIRREDIENNGIVIYGLASLGRMISEKLIQNGIEIRFIVDRNIDIQGTSFKGIPIRPISALASAGSSFVMLSSTHVLDMKDECGRYGVERWILPASIRRWCYVADIGVCTGYDIEEQAEWLYSSYSILADQKSRDIFLAFIRFHYTFENDFSKLRDPVLYFPDDLREKIDYSRFIDAGAFIGDTLSDWVSVFKPAVGNCSYFAFEPDSAAFSKLSAYIKTLPAAVRRSVHTRKCALGKESGLVNMLGSEGAATIIEGVGAGDTPCERIDDLFKDLYPTIIKADVEGGEMNLLRGAEETIRRCRPALAISVYHKYTDICEIPEWINSLNLGYGIYLRHHPAVFTDTVCYAIPK